MPYAAGKAIADANQRLARALSHPVRVEALAILNTQTASPNEIAKELDRHVGNVAYHVSELVKCGCAELVDTKQRRGATEHFYRAVAPRYLTEEHWAQLDLNVRTSISLHAFRVLVGAARESVDAELFDARTDRHVSVLTYDLDDQAWTEAKQLYKDLLDRIMEIGVESEGRLADGTTERELRATFGLLAFESPSTSQE